jgi:hypothetical protein
MSDDATEFLMRFLKPEGQSFNASQERILKAIESARREAYSKGYKADQEAMRERASAVCDGWRKRKLCADNICALPIEEPTAQQLS